MADFDKLRPLETEDEEFRMLLSVTDEFQRQTKGSVNLKSGKATLKVIHSYLVEKGVNLPLNPEIRIKEVKSKMHLLFLLKNGVYRNSLEYSINDINLVLKITNNAVGKAASEGIRRKFEEFRQFYQDLKLCAIVLSERLDYPYPVALDNVFTLVVRRRRANKLYLREKIIQLQRNRELRQPREKGWNELLRFLARSS